MASAKLAPPRQVAVLVGSLRQASLSRKLAGVLRTLAPPGLTLTLVGLGELALYDEDLEAAAPASWTRFRTAVRAADALLFVTPEYNRSVPGALKNALDVGSGPTTANVWAGKPGAVISLSPGALGGFGANHHLRQALVAVDVAVLAQPEIYLGGADALFDEAGALTSVPVRTLLEKFMRVFAFWIERIAPRTP